MRELAVELKQLRMHGMAGAWADLVEQGGGGAGGAALESSRWLLEHLLQLLRRLLRLTRRDPSELLKLKLLTGSGKVSRVSHTQWK